MIDCYYRFNDTHLMYEMLLNLGLVAINDANEYIVIPSHQYALCDVGEIPGKEGYHINLRILDPNFDTSSLIPYQVFPTNPVCVWA